MSLCRSMVKQFVLNKEGYMNTPRNVLIQEVARIALEDHETRSRVAHELGVPVKDLLDLWRHLEDLVTKEN